MTAALSAPLRLAAAALLFAPLAAQTQPPQDRLRTLLLELAGMDAKAWAARLAELEQQAKTFDARAAELRAQASKLQKDADGADAAAKDVRTQIERVKQMQALAAGLPKPAAPAKSEPKVEPKSEPKVDAAPMATPAPAEVVTWDHVAPLFAEHCTKCHDPDDKEGGLDLTSFAAARAGGGSGETITPGEPDQSRLYRLASRQERPFMPRGADPLSAASLARIKQWIEHGAADDIGAARAFLARRDAEGKLAAAATAADDDADAAPMPIDLPALEVREPAHAAPLRSLARSPRAPLLALPGLQQVRLLDAELQPVGALACPLEVVTTVAFASDGTQLVAGGGKPGRRGRAVVYDVRSGQVLGECGAEKDTPLAVAVHARGGLVALGGASKQVRVHALADDKVAFAGKHDDFVLALDFTRDGAWLAAGDRSGTIKVWDVGTGRVEQTLSGHRGAVHAVAFHRGGKSLASAGADGTLRLWDVAEGKERWRRNAHQGEALAVAFGPDDALATGGSDGRVRLFDVQGRERGTSNAFGDWLYAVAFGKDGKTVFAGDWQGRTHRFAAK